MSLMQLMQYTEALITVRRAQMRADERGDGALGTMIMIAIFAAAAITAGYIIYDKVIAKAESVPTD